ncbi:MAG: HAMP domain-containing protein [Chloroflexi bacterium]|nr:HAMP domain-containing protein [Chloroflexota bacterium]
MTIDARALRQPIRRRMLLSLTAGIALLVVLGTAGIFLIASSQATFAAQSETLDALSNARRLLIQAVDLEETDVLDYELTHSQRASGEFDAAARDALTYGTRLADLSSDDPRLAIVAQEVSSLTASWHDEWAAPLMRSLRAGNPVPTTGSLTADEGERRFQMVENAFSDLDRAIEANRVAVAAAQATDTDRIVAVVGAAIAIEAVGMLTLAVWLLRVVSAPLARLSRTAASLVHGNPVSFSAEREDEIGTLATVLEQLRLDLEAPLPRHQTGVRLSGRRRGRRPGRALPRARRGHRGRRLCPDDGPGPGHGRDPSGTHRCSPGGRRHAGRDPRRRADRRGTRQCTSDEDARRPRDDRRHDRPAQCPLL